MTLGRVIFGAGTLAMRAAWLTTCFWSCGENIVIVDDFSLECEKFSVNRIRVDGDAETIEVVGWRIPLPVGGFLRSSQQRFVVDLKARRVEKVELDGTEACGESSEDLCSEGPPDEAVLVSAGPYRPPWHEAGSFHVQPGFDAIFPEEGLGYEEDFCPSNYPEDKQDQCVHPFDARRRGRGVVSATTKGGDTIRVYAVFDFLSYCQDEGVLTSLIVLRCGEECCLAETYDLLWASKQGFADALPNWPSTNGLASTTQELHEYVCAGDRSGSDECGALERFSDVDEICECIPNWCVSDGFSDRDDCSVDYWWEYPNEGYLSCQVCSGCRADAKASQVD